jgi:hypothetical protein
MLVIFFAFFSFFWYNIFISPEQLSPELMCLNMAVLGLTFYAALILGLEIGGLKNGYRGLGIEFHQRTVEMIMKTLRNIFYNNSKRK